MRYALLLALLLTGCAKMVYPKHVAAITEACKDKGGWAEIDPRIVPTGRCADGTEVGELRGDK